MPEAAITTERLWDSPGLATPPDSPAITLARALTDNEQRIVLDHGQDAEVLVFDLAP